MTNSNFIGVDYGAKLAGTTVIAFFDELNQKVNFAASKKKEDSDLFITSWIKENSVENIYIDAPLSLPGVFIYPESNKYSNYFYREADVTLKAMSPMFLGGLTARAMKLASINKNCKFHEVYPGGLIRSLDWDKEIYKKEKATIPLALNKIKKELSLPETIVNEVPNWHFFDAFLAWSIGWKHENNFAQKFGNPEEGEILI